jgi:hypothetical protein
MNGRHLRLALSVFLAAALAAGCSSAALPTPAISPSAATSPTPIATIIALGPGQQALEGGTYRIDLATAKTVHNAALPSALITVPAGWANYNGFALQRGLVDGAPIAVSFWDVGQVFGQPCHWKGTLFEPGPTVDDLAKALVGIPLRNATQPMAITLDGYAGKYLEWSVPADIQFSASGLPDLSEGCDADEGGPAFQSWLGVSAGNRYQQGPGQVDRLWILDVDGARLVIDAFSMPAATSKERDELSEVVASIRFER